MKFICKAHTQDEYYENDATHAIIDITPELAETIMKLHGCLMASKKSFMSAYTITAWDYTPDYVKEVECECAEYSCDCELPDETEFLTIEHKYEESDMVPDTALMHVADTSVWWTCNIKHALINVDMSSISIEEIRRCLKKK